MLNGANKIGSPRKPNVSQPPAWSCATEDILILARREAAVSLAEHLELQPHHWLVDKLVETDEDVRREHYELVRHFIGRVVPSDGPSRAGLPVDRAHAELRLWLQTYAGRKVA